MRCGWGGPPPRGGPPPPGAGHSERRRWPGGAGARVCGPATFEKPGRAGALGPRERDVAGRTRWACARPGKGLRTPHHLLQNGHQRPAHVLHPAPSRPLSAAWPAFPGSGALLGLAFLLMNFRGPPSAHLRGPRGHTGDRAAQPRAGRWDSGHGRVSEGLDCWPGVQGTCHSTVSVRRFKCRSEEAQLDNSS